MWDSLQHKIKVLNEQVWEGRVTWPAVERWLGNFSGETTSVDVERLSALYLLASMMYFGSREIRALLKAMYRDAYRYPIIARLRQANGDTTDERLLGALYLRELRATLFLGIGNPSESGTHLLYHFRQENLLSKSLFINTHEIFQH